MRPTHQAPFMALLAVAVAACNGDSASFEDFFPADNEVGSWAADSAEGGALEQTTTNHELEALIDGDVDAIFVNSGDEYVRFGRKPYTDGTYKLELRIWQLDSASTCEAVYDGYAEYSLYSSIEWQPVAIGDEARAGDGGTAYWYNVRKGPYFIDAQAIRRADGEAVTSAALQAADPFVRAVAEKIP